MLVSAARQEPIWRIFKKTQPAERFWAPGPSLSDSSRKTMPNDGIGVQKGAYMTPGLGHGRRRPLVSPPSKYRSTSDALFSAEKSPFGGVKRFRRDTFVYLHFGTARLQSTLKLSTSGKLSTLQKERVSSVATSAGPRQALLGPTASLRFRPCAAWRPPPI